MTDRPILIVDGVDFWRDPTLEELIDHVGAKPVDDPASLHLHGVTPAEWDALYEVLEMAEADRPGGGPRP